MGYYDFRSDTCTMPTEEMYKSIKNARLGNDGYGDDPTVNELEGKAAAMLGKERALIVPSGTMGNLIALMTHCNPGDEVIVEADAHIYLDELGGIGRIAQLIPRPVRGIKGVMDPDSIEDSIRPAGGKQPETGLVCIENTHNRAGGVVIPPDKIEEISNVAHKHGIPVHIDGARIFNAAASLGIDVKELVAPADSVMFCLSKGLCCPIGSLLAGSEEFIDRARRARHILGGGMRQSGIIAACGIVALSEMTGRLSIDHKNAKKLAEGLVNLPYIQLDIDTVQTNIVRFIIPEEKFNGMKLSARLKEMGVLVDYKGNGSYRMVTHKDIDEAAVENALSCIEKELIQ